MKLFQLNERMGVVISGRAFLSNTTGGLKNTGYFIDEFRQKILQEGWNTKTVAEEINAYLAALFVAKEMAALREQITKFVEGKAGTALVMPERDGVFQKFSYTKSDGSPEEGTWSIDTIDFLLAGIDTDGVGRVYYSNVPKPVEGPTSTDTGGARWIGQTDVVTRIIRGWAPEVWNLPAIKQNITQIQDDLNKLEYIVNWGTMTLQDAVDFCLLVTRTTESIQRFSDGTSLQPGGIPGVGGSIDVAALTPEKGFCWLKRKVLAVDGEKTDLDAKPSLQ
jgi:hypothetical protein